MQKNAIEKEKNEKASKIAMKDKQRNCIENRGERAWKKKYWIEDRELHLRLKLTDLSYVIEKITSDGLDY